MTGTWPGHKFAAAFGGLVLIVWLIVMAVTMRQAALPLEAPGPLLAVFEPGMSEDEMFARIIAANGKPLRGTWLGFVWVVAGEDKGLAGRLESQGAIGTYAELPFNPSLAGCFAYADAKVSEVFSLRP
ncbi:hypothetical protein [Taklimakanibacter deserti]|uniref:hypothetical protein n=1 Tax=Taklimakanibacter deserti TaxID=2267839 RepID=UPI000E65A135